MILHLAGRYGVNKSGRTMIIRRMSAERGMSVEAFAHMLNVLLYLGEPVGRGQGSSRRDASVHVKVTG